MNNCGNPFREGTIAYRVFESYHGKCKKSIEQNIRRKHKRTSIIDLSPQYIENLKRQLLGDTK